MGIDTETDLALIAGTIDSNGDAVPQDHPIENPGPPEKAADDEDIARPHPDEPGTPEPQEPAEEEVDR